MKYSFQYLCSVFIFMLTACNAQSNQKQDAKIVTKDRAIVNPSEASILTRFNAPLGYEIVHVDTNSFAYYLQNLALCKMGSQVHYYNGALKTNNHVYVSVIEMDIDKQDLQQCADAVMRLKAEYHYWNKEYSKIHFNFVSDGKARHYNNYAKDDYSYKTFRKFMRYVFSYANTASLYHELQRVDNFHDMQIGDVFIQKGRPYGHAVIVVNMAENNENGEKLFMLAQSYMPAQETQILVNRSQPKISPWYELKAGSISTPEWDFVSTDLRRFKE